MHTADYFEGILGTSQSSSSVTVSDIQNLLPFHCSEDQCRDLQKEVTTEEVTAIIFSMPLDKSSGPDGFFVEFIRAAWDIVGEDIVSAVKELFRNGRLLKDFNNTIIALTPKVPEACRLGEFRPISLCNLMYKIITNIIAKRLKPVLLQCISPNQAAFLKGRSLRRMYCFLLSLSVIIRSLLALEAQC